MTLQHQLTALLPAVTDAVVAAGTTLHKRFASGDATPANRQNLIAAIDANDTAVKDMLRTELLAIRPGSDWVEEEEGGGTLPAGEWWIVDPVEGNVNHVLGTSGWGVTATLVRDGEPVLAVVYEPLQERLYTAIKGGGAYCNHRLLHVSRKEDLNAGIVGTGQARPGEGPAVYAAISASIHAMLNTALLVRMAVPATFEIVEVASGRMDAFWQYSQVRSGLTAGVLLVTEAGGVVTDTRGQAWNFASKDILLAAPGVHAAVLACLASAQMMVPQ